MDIVRLNVGGKSYMTSITTLTKIKDSMLSRMFSPDNSGMLKRLDDGSVFIDRDGKIFRYILEYLRDGGVPNIKESDRKRLSREAEYYALNGLVETLNTDTFVKPKHKVYPLINPHHPKGKAYETLIMKMLELKKNDERHWGMYIVDLRDNVNKWFLGLTVFGDELSVNFYHMKDWKVTQNSPLTYKDINVTYSTVFVSKDSSVLLELYGDNIHHEKISKYNRSSSITGFIKFGNQRKIPILLNYNIKY